MRASINARQNDVRMEITGGCLCRSGAFPDHGAQPIAMRLCWCRLCQYFAAGNATVNVVFPSDAITHRRRARAITAASPTAATSCTGASARPAARICSAPPRRGRTSSSCAMARSMTRRLLQPSATIWTDAGARVGLDRRDPAAARRAAAAGGLSTAGALIPARGRSNLPRNRESRRGRL